MHASSKMTSKLYQCFRQLLECTRVDVARTVNTTYACANWLIGPEIVEEEQGGQTSSGVWRAFDRITFSADHA